MAQITRVIRTNYCFSDSKKVCPSVSVVTLFLHCEVPCKHSWPSPWDMQIPWKILHHKGKKVSLVCGWSKWRSLHGFLKTWVLRWLFFSKSLNENFFWSLKAWKWLIKITNNMGVSDVFRPCLVCQLLQVLLLYCSLCISCYFCVT